VRALFNGAKCGDGAALGGAIRHIGRAFEELIRGIYETTTSKNKRQKNLSDMISQVCTYLAETAPEYEPHLLRDISEFLRRLRNASTHEQTSPELGHIEARLSMELFLATAEYFRVLHSKGFINQIDNSQSKEQKCSIKGTPGETYFFGLDGDDTGRELERLFQGNFEEEHISKFSTAIDLAMRAVSERVKLPPINGSILFSSGDDILFKGTYSSDALDELRALYAHVSGGHTCSIGFGRTPKDTYVAMKMAKAMPGKDSVVGIELISTPQLKSQSN
jgi:hypothetical protein